MLQVLSGAVEGKLLERELHGSSLEDGPPPTRSPRTPDPDSLERPVDGSSSFADASPFVAGLAWRSDPRLRRASRSGIHSRMLPSVDLEYAKIAEWNHSTSLPSATLSLMPRSGSLLTFAQCSHDHSPHAGARLFAFTYLHACYARRG